MSGCNKTTVQPNVTGEIANDFKSYDLVHKYFTSIIITKTCLYVVGIVIRPKP